MVIAVAIAVRRPGVSSWLGIDGAGLRSTAAAAGRSVALG